MYVRGIRGAITVNRDDSTEILEATRELLLVMQERNEVEIESIASILFTSTGDLKAGFPALAARKLGWNNVPLICFQEIEVPGALPMCIRVLMHVNTLKSQDEIEHVFLRKARQLRPDLLR